MPPPLPILPNPPMQTNVANLLPKDLDPVSPESDHNSLGSETPAKDEQNNNESSPKYNENNNSQLSGISELSSHVGDSMIDNIVNSNSINSISSPKPNSVDLQYDNFSNLTEKIKQSEISHGHVSTSQNPGNLEDIKPETIPIPDDIHEPSKLSMKTEHNDVKLESVSSNSLSYFEDSKTFVTNKFLKEDSCSRLSEDSVSSSYNNKNKHPSSTKLLHDFENSNYTEKYEKNSLLNELSFTKNCKEGMDIKEKLDTKTVDINKESKKTDDKDKKSRDTSTSSSKYSKSNDTKHRHSDSKHRSSNDKREDKDKRDDSKSSKDRHHKDDKDRSSKDDKERSRHKDDKTKDRYRDKEKHGEVINKKEKPELKDNTEKKQEKDKSSNKHDRDKDKSSRSKHDRDKEKHEKDKRDKEKQDKDKDRKDRDKSRHDKDKDRERHEKEKTKSNEDKNKDSKKHERSSHSTSTKKVDKCYDKDKHSKSSESSKYKHNGEKNKADDEKRDRKRKSERCNDDVKSKEMRRSSDRDSSGGKGGSTHRINSENRSSTGLESSKSNSDKRTKSSTTDAPSDQTDDYEQIDELTEVDLIISKLTSSIEEVENMENKRIPDEIIIKKPKIAKNIFEIRKVMQARKTIDRKYREDLTRNRKECSAVTVENEGSSISETANEGSEAKIPEENKENIKTPSIDNAKFSRNIKFKKFYGFNQIEIEKSIKNFRQTYSCIKRLGYSYNGIVYDKMDIRNFRFNDVEFFDNNLNNLKPMIRAFEGEDMMSSDEKFYENLAKRYVSLKNVTESKECSVRINEIKLPEEHEHSTVSTRKKSRKRTYSRSNNQETDKIKGAVHNQVPLRGITEQEIVSTTHIDEDGITRLSAQSIDKFISKSIGAQQTSSISPVSRRLRFIKKDRKKKLVNTFFMN